MYKQPFLLTLLVLTNSLLFAQLNKEDYEVYAAIIKTEILDSTKSVAIIKNGINSSEKIENTSSTADQLASKNISDKYQVYLWTENSKKDRPSTIDSINSKLLIDYCKSTSDKFIFRDAFSQNYKTILINKYPIRRKSIEKDWKKFYDRYPGSGGIFSFSKISYYTEGKTTAIFYYWVRRNGLNGHGAIAIMIKTDGEWQIKYKTYLWWN